MRILSAVFVAFALASAGPAAAAERTWKVFGGYDYFLPSNSGQGLRDQLNAQEETLQAAGYGATQFSVNTNGGVGTHAGILFPFDNRSRIGARIGYVIGPTANSDFTASHPVKGTGGTTISRAATYVRLLGDQQLTLETGPWKIHFDSSLGVGVGHADQSCTASGSLACPFAAASRTWVGFAWDFSPSIGYQLKTTELNVGLRYAGFPRYKGDDQIAAIAWQSLGFFLGATF